MVGAVGYTAYTIGSHQQFNTNTMLMAAGGGALAGGLIGTGVGLANGLSVAAATTAAVTTGGVVETVNAACGGDMCASEEQDIVSAGSETLPAIESQVQTVAQDAYGGLTKATQYGIDTYNNLKNVVSDTGVQVHHLIEQRFKSLVGYSQGKFASVVVTPEEHQIFTNAWRVAIGYGQGTINATVNDLINAVSNVYKDYPALKDAASQMFLQQ